MVKTGVMRNLVRGEDASEKVVGGVGLIFAPDIMSHGATLAPHRTRACL